jgi:hypothetical protein
MTSTRGVTLISLNTSSSAFVEIAIMQLLL